MKKTVLKRRQLKFDEINSLASEIAVDSEEAWLALPPKERRRRKDLFWDCLWDWLIDGWAAGLLFVGEDKDIPDLTYLLNWVYPRGETTSEIFDKDVIDREALEKMIGDEANRVFNCGMLEAGKGVKGLTKTWNGMMDWRERDTHVGLEGITIPIDEDFITYTGSAGQAPGLFDDASENCSCRCWLTLNRT